MDCAEPLVGRPWQTGTLVEESVQHVVVLSRVAVLVRHWFEIDLDDASMEHGARIELRELAAQPRRGSESAAQLLTLDRPLWRADLFDRHTDAPGTFGVAHYHPRFLDNEPCPRVWDAQLSASPWAWLREQFAQLGAVRGNPPWQLEPADGRQLSRLSGVVVDLATQFAPDRCRSARECCELTRDVRDVVALMIKSLRRPDLLDEAWVAPWRNTA
jgi:hypothetical protein